MSSDLPGSGTPPEAAPTEERLQAYVDANAGRFTDEAITAELVRAGYAPDAIRAVLAEAAARGQVMPPTGRAVKTILAAYAITFAILSLGMLVNAGADLGSYMPNAVVGIAILAFSLFVAFVGSLIWISSRRVFAIAAAVLLGISGVIGIASSPGFPGVVLLAIAIGIGVLALRTPSALVGRTTTLGVLLVVPALLLLVVGGICVASGLPIPRAG